MPMNASQSHLLKGFQNGEFRRALHSFLMEKCPADFQADSELVFERGLRIIRDYILKRQAETVNGAAAPA
jgi:hypothetical protein